MRIRAATSFVRGVFIGGIKMASSMERVTKADLMQKLSHLGDNDFVGVLASAQDGRESPCHEVLILFHPTENIVGK